MPTFPAVLISAIILTGCGPLAVYEAVQAREMIKGGKMPPASIQRTCSQAGTVRAADGAWAWDQAATLTCYRDHGWEPTGTTLGGLPAWRRVEEGGMISHDKEEGTNGNQ
jgi:hypothetical protein